MDRMFYDATNLTSIPTNAPKLDGIDSFEGMFYNAKKFNQPINHWEVNTRDSAEGWECAPYITNFAFMFAGATNFNQPLDSWRIPTASDMCNGGTGEVSAWVDMTGMFRGATAFNQPLDSWHTEAVRRTAMMFSYATSFNQPLDTWNVRNVEDMREMFR